MCNLCRKWLTLDIIDDLEVERFFEVGVGGGDILIALGNAGLHGEGIDQAPEAVAICDQRIKKAGLSERVSVSGRDLFTLQGAGDFDLVIAYEVLEHIEEDRAALHTLHGLVKSNGYLLVSVPAHMSKWGAIDVWAGHVRRYERDELEGKIRDAGFEVMRTLSYGYPLLNMTRQVRNVIYSRELRDGESISERTERSGIDRPGLGRLLKPLIPLYSWLVFQTGKPFLNRELGEQYLVLARRTD